MRNSLCHRAAGALACVLALVVALAASGCSGGASSAEDAQAAVDCVEQKMASVAALEPESRQLVEDNLQEHAGKQLAKMGVDGSELVDDYFRDFSYEVGEASVSGNSAQVSVSVTCRPVRQIVVDLVAACKGKWEGAGPTLWELLDSAEPQTVELTVSCVKSSDGTWSCDDGLTRALTDLCLK